MFIFCLLAVAFAEKAFLLSGDSEYTKIDVVVASVTLDNAIYLKYDENTCLYFGSTETNKYIKEGDKVKYLKYENDKCDGEPTENKDVTSQMLSKYTDVPKHSGFQSYIKDDDKCSHEKMTPRVYYKDGCNKIEVSVVGLKSSKYVKFSENEKKFYFTVYDDEKCETIYKVGSTEVKKDLFECDICKNGIKYQCGAFSTMILALLVLLAFLF